LNDLHQCTVSNPNSPDDQRIIGDMRFNSMYLG